MSKKKFIVVCCALIRREERVLLVKRPANKADGLKWEFPGGKVEPGESFEDCILREIQEELNLELALKGQLAPVEHENSERRLRLIPFLASEAKGVLELREHTDLKWATLEELGQYQLCEADRLLLDMLSQKALEETGWWQ